MCYRLEKAFKRVKKLRKLLIRNRVSWNLKSCLALCIKQISFFPAVFCVLRCSVLQLFGHREGQVEFSGRSGLELCTISRVRGWYWAILSLLLQEGNVPDV